MSDVFAGKLLRAGRFVTAAILIAVILAYGPWTLQSLESIKQLVLLAGTFILVIIALLYTIRTRTISIMWSGVSVALGISMILVAIATATSMVPHESIFGLPGGEAFSLVTMFALATIFVVTPMFCVEEAQRSSLRTWGALTGSAIALLAVPSLFGFSWGANLIGSAHGLLVFLLLMSGLGFGAMFVPMSREKEKGTDRTLEIVATCITTSIAAVMLVVLDSSVGAWVGLVMSISACVLLLSRPQQFPQPLRGLPWILLAIISLAILFLPSFLPSPFSLEAAPNARMSSEIVKGVWTHGRWIAGTGPGTFGLAYDAFHGPAVNATPYADVTFDVATSHVLTWLVTGGALALLGMLAIVIAVFAHIANFFQRPASRDAWRESAAYLPALIGAGVGLFLYPFSIAMLCVTIYLLLLFVMPTTNKKIVDLKARPAAFVGVLLSFLVVLGVMATGLFFVGKRYAAEIAYAHGIVLVTVSNDFAASGDQFSKAITLFPKNDAYYRALTEVRLVALSRMAGEQPDGAMLQREVGNAINIGLQATSEVPERAANWVLRARLYDELSVALPDADELALEAYTAAAERGPSYPAYAIGAAKAALRIADQEALKVQAGDATISAAAQEAQNAALARADEEVKRALALQPRNVQARYIAAALAERRGSVGDAVRELEIVQSQHPTDVGVGFELGLLYLRQGKNDVARVTFERLLKIAPTYVNAHWYLSYLDEEAKDFASAERHLQSILAITPEDPIVIGRLERLRARSTAPSIDPNPVPAPLLDPVAATP